MEAPNKKVITINFISIIGFSRRFKANKGTKSIYGICSSNGYSISTSGILRMGNLVVIFVVEGKGPEERRVPEELLHELEVYFTDLGFECKSLTIDAVD